MLCNVYLPYVHRKIKEWLVTKNALRFNLRGCNFSKFPGGMLQTPLAWHSWCFTCLCAPHTMTVYNLAIPTSTMMTHLAVPPSLSEVWIRPCMYSLPGMILFYLAATFLHQRCFWMRCVCMCVCNIFTPLIKVKSQCIRKCDITIALEC